MLDDVERTAAEAAATLRQVMADFASGVTIITTVWDGVAHAMTATAFASVSLDPPLVLVCVSKSSRFHAAITRAEYWVASLLSADQSWIARHFSNRGRDLRTQFDGVPHTTSRLTGTPVVTGVLSWLECVTEGMHDAGDHTIMVGRMVDGGPGSLLSPPASESVMSRPLTYYRGTYSDAI